MYMVCKRSLLACLVSIALLPVFVFAETQETIYDQALKAEEKGDIANALALFEKASNTEGPYTEEINEIIEVYKEALEIDESPWGLSFSAKISYAEISYKEEFLGQSETEHGKDLRFNAEVNLDYAMDNAMHSLGASFSTNWMISNEMPSLDTTKWSISPTIEYTLFLNDLLFNIGADFNIIEGDSLNIAPFTWTEVTLLHLDSQKFGIALWAYYRNDGYQTSTLYASWRYKSQNPLGSTVMIGAKFEADSVMNYSKKNKKDFSMYWGKWLGPTIRTRITYDFNLPFTLESRWNVFYGFAIDFPHASASMQKFTSTLGATLYWNLEPFRVFTGADLQYRRYINLQQSHSQQSHSSQHLPLLKKQPKLRQQAKQQLLSTLLQQNRKLS